MTASSLAGRFIGVTLLLVAVAASSLAQDSSHQITVVGVGTASAKPDTIEIIGTVTGEAELASDAVTKFRAAKEEALAAMNDLAIEGLIVKARGFSLGPSYAQDQGFFGQEGEPEAPKVAVREQLSIRMINIANREPAELLNVITKIIDAGKENGVAFGESETEYYGYGGYVPAYVMFSVSEQKKLKKAAMQAALKNAKENASDIAALSGGKLGPVNSVSTYEALSYVTDAFVETSPQLGGSTHAFRDIEVSISLTVQFAYTANE